ncbi:hypothetical protein MMC34_002005 [Xylographa carneopallida]|nr:hypothetical protein [Xylographa carneopallida]
MSTEGITTGALPYDPVQYCVLAACTAVAWAFAVELNLTIFLTFKRYRGLYFWSLLISSWGCVLHALGFILKFLVGTSWWVPIPWIEIGWVGMVTGQALVLFSRLHLVVRDYRITRYVLWMIIFDVFALHVPTIVFTVGSNSPNAAAWSSMFNVMERIQLTGFCIQEFIISTIYLWATIRILKSLSHRMTRRVMWQLILINSLCIGMDIVLICLEYTNEYVGEASIKPMLYAFKLKLEFAVLNQLVGLVQAGLYNGNRAGGDNAHEFGTGAPLSSNGPAWHNIHSANNQIVISTSTKAGRRASTLSPADRHELNQIHKTQHIEVSSEPAKSILTQSQSQYSPSSPTSVTFKDHKVASLMGTTRMAVSTGGRRSPSESEIEIVRDSLDEDKGTSIWKQDSSDGAS